MNQTKWLQIAEILDAYRIAPRIMFILIMAFVVWFTYFTTNWYFENFQQLGENAAMMYGSSGFLSITIPALFKFAIDYAKEYLNGGVKWKTQSEMNKCHECGTVLDK